VASLTSGTIVINGSVFDVDGNVIVGTFITSQISGAPGGVGTYFVSIIQLTETETMNSVSPTLTEVNVNINQEPSISALNVLVGTHA
jgi:hypothetical protein